LPLQAEVWQLVEVMRAIGQDVAAAKQQDVVQLSVEHRPAPALPGELLAVAPELYPAITPPYYRLNTMCTEKHWVYCAENDASHNTKTAFPANNATSGYSNVVMATSMWRHLVNE